MCRGTLSITIPYNCLLGVNGDAVDELINDVRAAFFVLGSVAPLYRDESKSFVEAVRSPILLKPVEPNRPAEG